MVVHFRSSMDAEQLKERDAYVEECCAQIQLQKGIKDIIVMNENCDPIKSTLSSESRLHDYTGLFGSLLFKARRVVRLINPKDELLEVRLQTLHHEAILTPDDKITFITLQRPVDLYQDA